MERLMASRKSEKSRATGEKPSLKGAAAVREIQPLPAPPPDDDQLQSDATIDELQARLKEVDRLLVEHNPRKGPYFDIQRDLISLIEHFMLNAGPHGGSISVETFSAMSGITKSNIGSILRGQRWVGRCERELIEALAKVLKVPVLQIYLLSGFIKPEDTVFSLGMKDTLDAIFSKMRKDTLVSGRIPGRSQWDSWPVSAKLSLCMMYELVTQKTLMRYATAVLGDDVKSVTEISAH